MVRFTAALVASFAAASTAFLVPSNILDDIVKDTRFHEEPKDHKDLVHALLAEKTEVVNLDCPQCPFALAHTENRDAGPIGDGIAWVQGVENSIHLEFDTHEHGFQVNGHPLYPFAAAQAASTTLVKATQIRKDTQERSIEFPLNFAMEILPTVTSPHKDNVELVPVEFTVLAMNGIPVKVPTISIKMVKTPNDEYVIAKVTTIPFNETPGAETCETSSSWSFCRVRAIFAARIKSMLELAKEHTNKAHEWVQTKTKGCKGKRPHSFGHPHHGPNHDQDNEHEHRPHHHHGSHHKHHRYHRVGHMLHQTFRFFIIPALLGIVGGLAASAIGMLVGQAIVFLWIRTYRNGERGPLRVQEIVIVDDEKDRLLDETDEALPVYEDVSRDIEAEAVPFTDEKH